MYTGFNLKIDKNATMFGDRYNYGVYEIIGKSHLNDQKARFREQLEAYVVDNVIDGTKIQNEWFPQIGADIFISHAHVDERLACALVGWINDTFGLTCFIDSNVWGYSSDLLEVMNAKFSNKRDDGNGGYLYGHKSCNKVSAHVNMMLSVALQKMIDKVEAVILLNTDNSIEVSSGEEMNSTYSPWIYAEIMCTEIVRRKPLWVYRDGEPLYHGDSGEALYEHAESNINISYKVQLEHLKKIRASDLLSWQEEYKSRRYKYALDALYYLLLSDEIKCQ